MADHSEHVNGLPLDNAAVSKEPGYSDEQLHEQECQSDLPVTTTTLEEFRRASPRASDLSEGTPQGFVEEATTVSAFSFIANASTLPSDDISHIESPSVLDANEDEPLDAKVEHGVAQGVEAHQQQVEEEQVDSSPPVASSFSFIAESSPVPSRTQPVASTSVSATSRFSFINQPATETPTASPMTQKPSIVNVQSSSVTKKRTSAVKRPGYARNAGDVSLNDSTLAAAPTTPSITARLGASSTPVASAPTPTAAASATPVAPQSTHAAGKPSLPPTSTPVAAAPPSPAASAPAVPAQQESSILAGLTITTPTISMTKSLGTEHSKAQTTPGGSLLAGLTLHVPPAASPRPAHNGLAAKTEAAFPVNATSSNSIPTTPVPTTAIVKEDVNASMKDFATSFLVTLTSADSALNELSKSELEIQTQIEASEAHISKLGASLDEASRAEEFDKADELQRQLTSCEQSVREKRAELEGLALKRKRLESNRQEVYSSKLYYEMEKLVAVLETNKQRSADKAESFRSESISFAEEANKRIEERRGALTSVIDRATKESAAAKEEEDRVSERMNAEKAHLEGDVSELRQALVDVEDELKRLEELVRLKTAEKEELLVKIKHVDDQITPILEQYSTRLSETQERAKSAAQEIEQAHRQRAELDAQVEALNQQSSDNHAEYKRLFHQSEVVERDHRVLVAFQTHVRAQVGLVKQRTTESAAEWSALLAAGELVKVKSDEAQRAQEEMLRVQAVIADSTSTQTELTTRVIPELERQKQAAVASKNFKEAGRATQELKDAVKQRDALQEATEAHTSRIDALLQACSEAEAAAKSQAQLYEERKRAYAEARCLDFSKQTRAAREAKAKVLEAAEGEASDEAESELLKGVVTILDAEIESCASRERDARERFGVRPEEEIAEKNSSTEAAQEAPAISESPSPAPPATTEQSESTQSVPIEEEAVATLEELEAELNAAVEQEDFELAEKLQQRIDAMSAPKEVVVAPDAEEGAPDAEEGAPDAKEGAPEEPPTSEEEAEKEEKEETPAPAAEDANVGTESE